MNSGRLILISSLSVLVDGSYCAADNSKVVDVLSNASNLLNVDLYGPEFSIVRSCKRCCSCQATPDLSLQDLDIVNVTSNQYYRIYVYTVRVISGYKRKSYCQQIVVNRRRQSLKCESSSTFYREIHQLSLSFREQMQLITGTSAMGKVITRS